MTSQSTHTLFKPLPGETAAAIEIFFNDQPLSVPGGRSVAAALLAAGVSRFRATPVSGAPRAPYCMMGACFECLVEIDGIPSRQSCMVEVQAGMRIRSQEGARDLPPMTLADTPLENAHGR
ncbi:MULTISPECIES: (2Fe-2S)-binding protein [unclassified Caballeronia]|uniref:(2Fe-2S)-binding protein n=1 Tax=unclassified Caballeronia TaxID=2646786 RepID=UPI002028A654|nr:MULTISPECIES: (2Fe-2S)-binding protein [unclassified Caballeronia]